MKKILVGLAVSVFLLPTVTIAGDFPLAIQLSKSVAGSYFVNATTDATEYSFSTAHSQGDRVYATSSNDSLIYYKQLSAPYQSSDLLDSHNASFSSDDAGFSNN